MATAPAEVEAQKQAAAERALELVKPGTIVGLGTGSTARYFIEGLALRVRNGLTVHAVVTSLESRALAEAGGIPIRERADGSLDLAVDGADEIDPAVNCVKGRGGALLREKIVAHASRQFVLIADETKLVGRLGRGPVPVEVLPFRREAAAPNGARRSIQDRQRQPGARHQLWRCRRGTRGGAPWDTRCHRARTVFRDGPGGDRRLRLRPPNTWRARVSLPYA